MKGSKQIVPREDLKSVSNFLNKISSEGLHLLKVAKDVEILVVRSGKCKGPFGICHEANRQTNKQTIISKRQQSQAHNI